MLQIEAVRKDTRYRAWANYTGDGRVILENVKRWQPAYRAKVFNRQTIDLGNRWVRVSAPSLGVQLALEKEYRRRRKEEG